MGVNKGTDNFSKFRDDSLINKLDLIAFQLNKQKKRKIQYTDFGSLVAHVSEKTGIHRTTLNRNPIYKSTLLQYLATQPGASNNVRDVDATPELLKAKLFDARLEIRNQKNQISILSKRLLKIGEDAIENVAVINDKNQNEPDWYLAFSDTAILLRLLIERLNIHEETIQIDTDKKQIIDLSAPSKHRVIASSERARWFIEYYRKLVAQEKPISTSSML
jgi:hypothetical protein